MKGKRFSVEQIVAVLKQAAQEAILSDLRWSENPQAGQCRRL